MDIDLHLHAFMFAIGLALMIMLQLQPSYASEHTLDDSAASCVTSNLDAHDETTGVVVPQVAKTTLEGRSTQVQPAPLFSEDRPTSIDDQVWQPPPPQHTAFDTGSYCNMQRLTMSDWTTMYQSNFMNHDIPYIIINYTSNQHEFARICQRHNLLQRYAKETVVLSSANTHSYDKRKVEFKKYVEESVSAPISMDNKAGETWYMFGDNKYDSWTNFTEHYHRPPFNYDREPFFSFGVAASGSGVPFHTHGAVFAEVVHGRKRWFVTPPNQKPHFDTETTSLIWTKRVYPHLDPQHPPIYDCTLGPGEVIYLGSGVWHSTLNIGETVFISTFI
eukprot:m.43575 g.43575  ORF g.43575 m.43575 type:complete len:332 (-) comp19411_c0_seq1:349-1344(-)